MSTTSAGSRTATPPSPDRGRSPSETRPGINEQAREEESQRGRVLTELREIPDELAGAADAVRSEIEGSWLARRSVRSYLWLMDRAPTSTRGRITLAALVFVVALA